MTRRNKTIPVRIIAGIAALLLLLPLGSCAALREKLPHWGEETADSGMDTEHRPTEDTESPNESGNEPSPVLPVPTIPDLTFAEVTTAELPEIYRDPMTGLLSAYDVSLTRPSLLIYDNCNAACPQNGISRAGIVIEVPAADGQTRLCALFNDCAYLPGKTLYGPVGEGNANTMSIARAFDAVHFCSGTDEISEDYLYESAEAPDLKLNIVDALSETGTQSGFWRDISRINAHGYSFSMSTTANTLAELPLYFGYSVKYASPLPDLLPIVQGTAQTPSGSSSNHIVITYSPYQRIQLIYDTKNQIYVRYQFGNKLHTDGDNDAALTFTNVIILYALPMEKDDAFLRLNGTGSGIVITHGKSNIIKWTRTDEDSGFDIKLQNGRTPVINPGKTLICVVPASVASDGGVLTDYNAKRDGDLE